MSITQISVNKQVLCLFLLQQGCFRLKINDHYTQSSLNSLHQNASIVMRSSKKLSSSLLLKKSIRRMSQTPGTRSKLQKKSCLPLSLRRYKSNCNRSSIRASCRNKNNTLLENIKIETCLKNAAENILKEWRAYPVDTLLEADVRIPLAWKNKDHFLNKGDSRSYAVFALCEIGDDIYDTRLVSHVDRTFTDIQFEETFVFKNVPAEFNLVITLYSRLISNGEDHESVENVKNKVLKPISRSLSRGPSIYEFFPPNFGFLCCNICINVNSKSKFTFDGYLTVQNNSGNYESVRCILRRVKLYIYWSNGLQTVNITADCTFTWETLKFTLTTVSGDVLVFTSCEVDVLEQFYRTLIHHRQGWLMFNNLHELILSFVHKLFNMVVIVTCAIWRRVSSEELNDGKKEEAVPPASPKVAAKRLIVLGEAASDVISVTSDPIDPKQSNPAISAINTELLIGVSESILTGFSLFHCLCVFASAETSVISVNFLNYYTHISLPIHSLYFGIVAICTVAILDKTTLLCLTWLFVNLRHESNTLLDLLGKPTVEVVDDNDKTKSDISR
ncbi:Rhotekin-2 [Trichinella patagoniensis]|uniref:Rhotekin-2 n=1 Tax=Trichinella patagoniensis TaxID=990121 RepID=A0A0V1AEM6_9BILA|nr:Rhotekin-2 [Trichinella patagoniensis]